MSVIIPRDYQDKCVKAGVHFFQSNKLVRPKMMVAPTAAGKSIIIALMANELEGNILILQPSVELLEQNYSKYKLFKDDAEIYSASAGKKNIGKVTFATLGSIVNVAELFQEFTILIIDEAHLYPPNQESMFGKFLKVNPQLKIMGLTATPFRLKSTASGAKLVMMHNANIYNGYSHIIQIQEISKDYWCPLEYILEETNEDVLKVNTTGAEYTEDSVTKYGLSVEEKIIKWVEDLGDASKIVFVPSVKQAEDLALKTGGAAISSNTPKKERKEIISGFKAGTISTVYNVNVLSVGFDHPGLMALIDACPTMSLARHYQKIGRLTRQHADKSIGKVIDLSGNTAKFGRVEDLEIRKVGTTYHVFSGDRQLTGVYFGDIIASKPAEKKTEFEDMVFPWGKFKGHKISQCPEWYISWCVDNINGNQKLISNIKKFLTKQ